MKLNFPMLLAAVVPIGAVSAQDLKIESLKRESSDVTLQFSLNDLDKVTALSLESADPLSEFDFVSDPRAVLSWSAAQNQFVFRAPEQMNDKGFYRITSALRFDAPDSDLDNLSDYIESIIGTTATGMSGFDTDGDGFGDAYELNNKSDPFLPSSMPEQPNLSFSETDSTVNEGDGALEISLSSNKPFSGTINISVLDLSTTDSDDFRKLPGTYSLNIGASGTGTISILLADDGELENSEAFIIDLEPGRGYLPLGRTRHTTILVDNDSYWSGAILAKDSQQPFRLCLICEGGKMSGEFVSAPAAGSGSVPAGNYPLSNLTLTETGFTATAADLPTSATKLFGEQNISRNLSFRAVPDETPYSVSSNQIIGSVTDTGTGDLTWTRNAEFLLIRDLPNFDKPVVPITLKE